MATIIAGARIAGAGELNALGVQSATAVLHGLGVATGNGRLTGGSPVTSPFAASSPYVSQAAALRFPAGWAAAGPSVLWFSEAQLAAWRATDPVTDMAVKVGAY